MTDIDITAMHYGQNQGREAAIKTEISIYFYTLAASLWFQLC